MTQVTYIGNLTADPELRFTPSGKAVANVNVAINTRTKRGDEYVDDPTLFVRVNIWEDQAENIAESLRKGDRVIVTGRQKQTEFTDRDGNTRQQLEVTADEIGPSLRWATAVAQKINRRQGGGFRGQPTDASQQYGGGTGHDRDPWAGQGGGNDQDPPF